MKPFLKALIGSLINILFVPVIPVLVLLAIEHLEPGRVSNDDFVFAFGGAFVYGLVQLFNEGFDALRNLWHNRLTRSAPMRSYQAGMNVRMVRGVPRTDKFNVYAIDQLDEQDAALLERAVRELVDRDRATNKDEASAWLRAKYNVLQALTNRFKA